MKIIIIIALEVITGITILNLSFSRYKFKDKYNNIVRRVNEYERIIDEQGKKNHEYNNQLMILKGYINNKDKLKNYLEKIILDYKTGQNYEIRQLHNFVDGGLKELLYYKIKKIKGNKIKYYLYISKEATKLLEDLNIELYSSITKVFGVLIDNAIEASLDSINKELSLDISNDNKYITITISNSYNTNIDLNRIGKGYTSKGKGHGYGLKLVDSIVRKNNKIELISDYDSKIFNQTILIDIK